MLLKQIEYFVAIVDYQSFTKAAEECYISQSAISQQMKALEKDLGVQLLVRKNRQFSLTPAGEYFYRHGKSLLRDAQILKDETIRRGSDSELTLRIGYPKNYAAIELQQAISQFASTYPEVNISIVTGTHEELFHMLVNQQIDLKLSEQRRAYNHDYYNFELKYSDCYVEISTNNPLSQKEKVTIDDLKKLSCILVTSKDSETSEKDFYQNTLNLSRNFMSADNLEQARMLVLGNRGFLPIDAIGKLPEPLSGIKRIPLYQNEKKVQRNYFACWAKENTNYYIEEFAELLRKLLQVEE